MKKRLYLLVPSLLLVLFIVFTILVKTVNVHYLPNNSFIGLYSFNSAINGWVTELNKLNAMDKLSDVVLYISFAFPLAFFIVGVVQWIKRKSLKLVDPHLFVLVGVYVLLVVLYFVFELAKINLAPIANEDNVFKPSYPSTHVLFTVVLFFTGIYAAIQMININSKYLRVVTYCLLGIMLLLIGFVRLLSGNHWASDIIASYILSGVVLSSFIYIYRLLPFQESPVLEE